MNDQTGEVTFLFTDIEGSTQLWQADSDAMAIALAEHDALLRSVCAAHRGHLFKHTGDGMCMVFESPRDAIAAALAAQADLGLPVRMGLHTGEAVSRDGDYFGPTLNRAARVMDAGHGGQILLSTFTANLLDDLELVDLGEHLLKGLAVPERIFQVGTGEFPPLRTPRPQVGNLPVELSTFIGRTEDVDALAATIAENRLVTLIGVGGTGKTRLAIETGLTVAPSFIDGCWLIDLARVAVEEMVPLTFASGLGVTPPSDGDVVEHIVMRFATKRSLLIVDNCEHVIAASAEVVEQLVAACPDVVVIATSREPLMVRGERLVPVASLRPDDAVQLFIDRARDEAPDLVIDDEQRTAITELCRRLDGLPLAVELAASRVRAFTPVELVAALEERFRMLVGGRRSRLERHQTMRGTLDWSYELCNPTERAVFDRLSVFPAAFDLAAARAVASGDDVDEFDVVDVVPQLVDRSLLQRSTATDGTTRYRMLETMRAYGREHLQHAGSSDVVRERHSMYMARTIAAVTLETLGPREEDALRRHTEYVPDALVALDWFIERDDWEHALCVAVEGQYVSERESVEMIARLHDAAKASGASGPVLDELQRSDLRIRHLESTEESFTRGWRSIRERTPIPSNRFAMPPHADFNVGGIDVADVDEFVASLERWESAPLLSRFDANWWAIRSLSNNGHIAQAAEVLARFEPFVQGLGSQRAIRLVAELHGVLALHHRNWREAAEWYQRVTDGAQGGLTTWFDLMGAWNRLIALCLCEDPPELTGDDLRDPWRCCLDEHIDVLQYRGAVATAIALHRLGLDDLANRLIAWLRAEDNLDVAVIFDPFLREAGVPTAIVQSTSDLRSLVDEVLAVAVRIDNRELVPGRRPAEALSPQG